MDAEDCDSFLRIATLLLHFVAEDDLKVEKFFSAVEKKPIVSFALKRNGSASF